MKFKDHERCVNDGSAVKFEEVELEDGKELLVVYVSHEWPELTTPDNARGDKIKALRKYSQALLSQYGGEDHAQLFFYFDYCCRRWEQGAKGTEDANLFYQSVRSVEAGYLWNCNHFLALVPSCLNYKREIQGLQTFSEDPKLQAECFMAYLSGMRHIYWTDGEIGGRFDLPKRYPACWGTHLAAQLALYSNIWAQFVRERDELVVPTPTPASNKGFLRFFFIQHDSRT